MTIDEFVAALDDRGRPSAPQAVDAFEREVGHALPEDYRGFLALCNGGYAAGRLVFTGPATAGGDEGAAINHVGGLRREYGFSLQQRRNRFQGGELRIPRSLLWVMDDPFGRQPDAPGRILPRVRRRRARGG